MSRPEPVSADPSREKVIAGVAYGLYGIGLLGTVLPLIVALVLNYLRLGESPPLYESHHRWMIRTFWWGLLWGVVGGALVFVFIGWAVLFAVFVWWVYRLLKGALALIDDRPVTAAP